MDTKLRSFNQNRLVKGIAFFLCVLLFLVSLLGAGYIFSKASESYYGNGIDDLLLYDNYRTSAVLQRDFEDKLSNILYILNEYKSEEYINSGKTITEQRLDDAIRSLFYDSTYYEQGYAYTDDGSATSITIVGENTMEKYGSNYDDPTVRQRFIADHTDKIEQLKQTMIMDDLRSFEAYKKELSDTKGFSYYATDGTNTISNISDKADAAPGSVMGAVNVNYFQAAPAYLIYQDDNLEKVPASAEGFSGSMKILDKKLESNLDEQYNPALKVYFSYDEGCLKTQETEFAEAKAEIVQWLPMSIVCALMSLILLIYLIVVTGKKDEAGNYIVCRADRIFTEIQLLIIGVLFVGGGTMFLRFLLETVNYGFGIGDAVYSSNDPLYLSIALALVIGLFSAGFGLYFILSVVRNLKARRFLGNSLIYIAVSALWRGLKAFYLGGSLMKKVVLITLAICLLSSTVILAPVAAALIIILAPKWVKKFEEVKKGVNEVKSGNLTYKIKVDGNSELDELARGINQISEASNLAIQSELKNQRMKTDLISNVSHDLKTPLTSIITYIDLLKQEGLDNPEAPKYLEILDQKSIRLKKLTEDLFDAAKASSGAIPVKFEKVDMLSLINQGLGEMSDRIEASNLDFKVNAQKEKYYVNADGQLLWRVVENLLGNVLKYAQEGSRVYIDLYEQEVKTGRVTNVVLEIKNISKLELNIDADELMERFKRGDESRTTEGSGLGLAIAKDLVRLQNGWFEIKIDGDLFKAIVTLEAYAKESREE